MTFRLTVDGPRWDQTLRQVYERSPGLVPVIKGNGYGFGRALLAGRCESLGAPTVAVGTPAEVEAVRSAYSGEILVLEPLQLSELRGQIPGLGAAGLSTEVRMSDGPVLRTVAHTDVLNAVGELVRPPRIVLELDSPVHRYGIALGELPALKPVLARVPFAGAAIHLPVNGDRRHAVQTAHRAIGALRSAGIEPGALWVSHLSTEEVAWLRQQEPQTQIRPRVGTGLWLADRKTFKVTGAVLDTHPVRPHEGVGYRQRKPPAGTLIVVSGGTAHGVGLQASSARGRWRDLIRAALAGAAHGAGMTPSPFWWTDQKLHFADVPHLQVSMLLVPAGLIPPRPGDRLPCSARMTVTTFDEILVRTLDSPIAIQGRPLPPGPADQAFFHCE